MMNVNLGFFTFQQSSSNITAAPHFNPESLFLKKENKRLELS